MSPPSAIPGPSEQTPRAPRGAPAAQHDGQAATAAPRTPPTYLERIAEQTTALLSYVDTEFRYRFVNRAYEGWFGRSRESLVGRHVSEVIGPEAWGFVEPNLRSTLAGTPTVVEAPINLRDAGVRWMRVEYTPDTDESGAVRGVIVQATEIAEQKRVEEELRVSEARAVSLASELRHRVEELQGLLDLLPVGVFIAHNPECSQMTANPAGLAMLGVPSGNNPSKTGPAAAGLPFRVYKDGAEIPDHDLPMQRAARLNVEIVDDRIEIARADGKRSILWEFAKPLSAADGSVRGVLGVFVDITDRVAMEEALRESEAMFRKLFEANAVGLALADADGTLREVNDAFLTLIGYTREDFVQGRVNWRALTPPEHLTRDIDAITETLSTGRHTPFEKKYIRKDGSRVPVLVGLSLISRDPPQGLGTVVDLTPLREAERARRDLDAKLQLAMSVGQMGTWDFDGVTNAVTTSASTDVIYGLPPGVPGRTIDDYMHSVHPEDRERLKQATIDAAAGGRGIDIEYRLLRPDGSVRWIVSRGDIVTDEAGNVLRMAGALFDVTDRKLAERALQQSEARFRRLYESNVVGMVYGDFSGRIIEANDEFLRIIGYTREDLRQGRIDWRSLTPAEHLTKDLATLPELLNTGRHTPFEKEYIRKDGSRVPVLIGTAYLGGAPGEAFSTVVDLTPMRRAERAIRESEHRFRTLADATSALVWVNGPDGGCELVNQSYMEFFAKPMDELRGMAWAEFLHPDDAPAYMEAYAKAFQERRPFKGEARIRRHDGAYRWIQSESRPRFTEAGEFLGTVGSAVDVTEVVEAREYLRHAKEDMERLVQERTAQLETSHARLRISERMATIGTLSAGLGHDMGNLLLPIRERIDSLRSRSPDPESQDDLNTIGRCMDYLNRMTQGLRLLAMDPEERTAGEVTEVREWWAQTEPVLRNALPRAGTLESSLPETPARVLIGRAALSQAVFNLVQNAADALRNRPDGKVIIRAEPAPGENAVRLIVADNGPGMPEEVQRRCFEPFFTTKTRGLSTGLGLALVHGIVQRAGGRITLDSAPGRGTTFTLTLPAPAARAGPDAADDAPAAVSIADPQLHAFVVSLLSALGFTAAPPPGDPASPPADPRTRLWVIQAPHLTDGAAAAFLEADPARRIVLITEKNAEPGPAGAIRTSPPRPSQLRRALADAAAECRAAPLPDTRPA